MPVAVGRDPFSVPVSPKSTLRTLQARVLAVLMPESLGAPLIDWPLCNRSQLGTSAGYTSLSGSCTRALNGVREGSSSGDAHLGILALGYVVEVVLDVEGVTEMNYRATPAGVAAFAAYITEHGAMPPLRDITACRNKRQGKGETHRSKISKKVVDSSKKVVDSANNMA